MVESHEECNAFFEEALKLAQAAHTHESQQRLDFLLSRFFQDDDSGAHFRSMICYGFSGVTVSVAAFNSHIVHPRSNYCIKLCSTSATLPLRLMRESLSDQRNLRSDTMKLATASVLYMLDFVVFHHFPDNDDVKYFTEDTAIPQKWINCIIHGKIDRATIVAVEIPSFFDFQHRIHKSLEHSVAQKLASPQSKFFSIESAMAWQNSYIESPTTSLYDDLYLEACSLFPSYLKDLLGPDQYLDELAGVDVGHAYPEVEARFSKMYSQSPERRVEGIDLRLSEHSPKIGGTVLALHQYISPSFLAYYTVDHDASCSYMQDERSTTHKKERKIRVASMDHVDTKPTWLQFGDTKDVYLYLSQKASTAEEKWLSVVNFVMNLLVDFVNAKIKAQPGGSGRLELMRKRDYRVAVGSASNPLEGNFGWHGDGKNGIVVPGDADYSTYQLMVPTFCIQNYAHANTKIEWAPVSDPSFIAGTVLQECILLHIQLLNVNAIYRHHGETDNSAVPPGHMFDFEWRVADEDDSAAAGGGDEIIYNMNLGVGADPSDNESTDSADKAVAGPAGIDDANDDDQTSIDGYMLTPQKRVTFSARESPPQLQNAGIKQLLDDTQDLSLSLDPTVFGFEYDYIYYHVLGVTSHYHQCLVGSTKEGALNSSVAIPRKRRTFKEVFNISERKKIAPPKIGGLDLGQYNYSLRVVDKAIWPQSNEKKVASVKTAHQMLTSRPMVDWCRSDGIIPVVTYPHGKDLKKARSIKVAIGPHLDTSNNPHPLGKCFRAAAVYLHFGMRLHVDHNEAWRSNAETLSAFFLRHPPKNSLPITTPNINRKSPYAEMQRIILNMPREGMDIYRSGGNATIKGNAPPGTGAKSAGEGAFFEHEQSIKNAYNYALETVSESGRPLAVFGAGPLFPRKFHDQELIKDIGLAEQAFYYGTYTVTALGQRAPLTTDDIGQVMREYGPVYEELSSAHLRFLLVPHRAYRLVPVEYPSRSGGYKHLSIDSRDNRRPLFELPAKVSFQKAFEINTSTSHGVPTPPFDEYTMFRKWYSSGGLDEFLLNPYVPGSSKTPGPNSRLVDWDFSAPDCAALAEPAFAPIQTPVAPKTSALAEFEVKTNSIKENFWIVMVCSVASFCRELELHVDVDGCIGPLVDADCEYHKNGSKLANYLNVFGAESRKYNYLEMLGLEMQRSPLPHPIRTYDANRRWLLSCCGGGNMRVTRGGVSYIRKNFISAVDHLFQSLIVEVVRVPILREWSLYKSQDAMSLPGINDIEAFLNFLDSVRHEKKWRTMSNILQTQYELHEGFIKPSSFSRLMKHLGVSLNAWLQAAVGTSGRPDAKNSNELFTKSIASLSSLLGCSQALGSNGAKLPFFCQHVLSNMNELYDDWPLGRPGEAISGFGGLFGIDRIRRGLGGKKSMAEILQSMMEYIHTRSTSELALVGLLKNKEGVVVLELNGRPVTCLDTEHWCCVMMPYTERMVGGTRGLGNRYHVTSTHCQPVRNLNICEDLARGALLHFRRLVDSGVWQTMANDVVGVSGGLAHCVVNLEDKSGGEESSVDSEDKSHDEKLVQPSTTSGDEESSVNSEDKSQDEESGQPSTTSEDEESSDNSKDKSHVEEFGQPSTTDEGDKDIPTEQAEEGYSVELEKEKEEEACPDDIVKKKATLARYHSSVVEEFVAKELANLGTPPEEGVGTIAKENDDSHSSDVKEDAEKKLAKTHSSFDGDKEVRKDKEILMPPDKRVTTKGQSKNSARKEDKCLEETEEGTDGYVRQGESNVTQSTNKRKRIHKLYDSGGRKISLHCCMVFGIGKTLDDAKIQLGNRRKQLLRDTARCISTENETGAVVFSLDSNPSEKPRDGRHIEMDLNKLDLQHPILGSLVGKVAQVTFDWVWFRDAHTNQRIKAPFYNQSLPEMAKLLCHGGAIYLPLSPCIFVGVVHVEELLKSVGLRISLLDVAEAEENFLFRGTEKVKNIWDLMHKVPDQLCKLGINEATVKERAESDERVLAKSICKRYGELAKGVDSHRFLKLSN